MTRGLRIPKKICLTWMTECCFGGGCFSESPCFTIISNDVFHDTISLDNCYERRRGTDTAALDTAEEQIQQIQEVWATEGVCKALALRQRSGWSELFLDFVRTSVSV